MLSIKCLSILFQGELEAAAFFLWSSTSRSCFMKRKSYMLFSLLASFLLLCLIIDFNIQIKIFKYNRFMLIYKKRRLFFLLFLLCDAGSKCKLCLIFLIEIIVNFIPVKSLLICWIFYLLPWSCFCWRFCIFIVMLKVLDEYN